jgi:hypothetical protein
MQVRGSPQLLSSYNGGSFPAAEIARKLSLTSTRAGIKAIRLFL